MDDLFCKFCGDPYNRKAEHPGGMWSEGVFICGRCEETTMAPLGAAMTAVQGVLSGLGVTDTAQAYQDIMLALADAGAVITPVERHVAQIQALRDEITELRAALGID